MSSDSEFIEMIKYCEKFNLKPVIDSVYNFEDYLEAFKKMAEGKQFGKIILKNN